jgi:hypothetical protein
MIGCFGLSRSLPCNNRAKRFTVALEGVAAAKQFPIDPGKLLQALQELSVRLDAAPGLDDLGLFLEQQSAHLALGQTSAQIKKGAMFFALAAMTIGAAAFEEAFEEGGMDRLGGHFEGLEEMGLTLAEGQG